MSISITSQAERVVARFDSRVHMTKVTGFDERQIRHWLKVGHVPYKHWMQILCTGIAAGVPISPSDFIACVSEQLAMHFAGQQNVGHSPASSAVPA